MDVREQPRISKIRRGFFSRHPDVLGAPGSTESEGRSGNETPSTDEKIAWLQSQLIGSGKEFETPFGVRRLTYADHTASGRCLRYVEDYIVQELLPVYGNTHTDDSFVGSKTTRMVHKASAYIKRCMGAGPNDAIVFCGSGTSAAVKRLQEVIGIAVPSVMRERLTECLRDEERWVVLVGPYEHHSNLLSWRQTTAEVVEISLDADGQVDMEELRRRLASPRYANRPMLGSFSAGSNVTGILSDTRAIARLLHQHGAFACFDFAASGPYVEIDMRSGDLEGYDAVFLSPHKFIGGPGTPGVLLMNKALYQLSSSPPSTCGGGTVEYVNGYSEKDTLYHEGIEEREDCGTPAIIQRVRSALAFWVKEYIGHGAIDLRERLYAEAAMGRLLRNPNVMVLGDVKAKRLPIISFVVFPPAPLQDSSEADDEIVDELDAARRRRSEGLPLRDAKPLHGRFVAKLLNDLFGIQARGGCACAGPYAHHLLGVDESLSLRLREVIKKGYSGVKPGWTRVSFTYYTTKEEFEFVLAAIEFVAAHGHRFHPLYQYDWTTGDWTFRKRMLKHQFVAMQEAEINAGDPAPPHGFLQAAAGGGFGVVKGNRRSPNSKGGGGVTTGSYESYLETARRIALSLPDNPITAAVPAEIDPNLVLFKI